MNYTMTTPCDACPFLNTPAMRRGFTKKRLDQFASGTFHCHKTGDVDDETGNFIPTENSQACAGQLIYNYKHHGPNQLMRVMERIGAYDRSKLNMQANVR